MKSNGFTLIELMIAIVIFGLVMISALEVYLMCQKMWHATSLSILTTRDGSLAMARLIYGIGTNNGLRTAATITIDSNYYGTWTGGTNYPPQPNATTHSILTNGTPDGSWRMICSNAFDGVRWIDFNKQASNIVCWADITDPISRQEVCNYLSNAVVSTTAAGVNIQLTFFRKDGQYTSVNQVSNFVQRRNN